MLNLNGFKKLKGGTEANASKRKHRLNSIGSNPTLSATFSLACVALS